MLSVLFSGIKSERIGRLTFLMYSVMLFIILFLCLFFSIGLGVLVEKNNVLDAATVLGGPALFLTIVAMIAVSFIQINLATKRARDIGLHGYPLILLMGVYYFSMGGSAVGSPIIHTIFTLLLVFTPTDFIRKS